jgi:hypothetical protein
VAVVVLDVVVGVVVLIDMALPSEMSASRKAQ